MGEILQLVLILHNPMRDYLELERSLGESTLTLEQRGEIGRLK